MLAYNYEFKFLFSLTYTILIEIIVLYFILKIRYLNNNVKYKYSQILFIGILCSFATLPYLWFILPILLNDYILYNIIGEIFVIIIESLILYFYLKLPYKKMLIVSFTCNIISYSIGLIISNITY